MRITIWKKLKWKLFGMTPEEFAELQRARKQNYIELMMMTGNTRQEAEEAFKKDDAYFQQKTAFLSAAKRKGISSDEAERQWDRLHG